jgi:hypothetical protein
MIDINPEPLKTTTSGRPAEAPTGSFEGSGHCIDAAQTEFTPISYNGTLD